MKNLFRIAVLFTLLFSLSACGGGDGPDADSEEAKVIEAYEAAWNEQDIDGVMALYAEDAVEKNPLGTFTGQSQIRDVTNMAMETFALECGNYKLNGNTLTYECVLKDYGDDADRTEIYEAVIENGKIKSNIFTGNK
ncbi:MAG TPA: nuclear transport factor 2 family protein [Anaerolineales bacterium]